MECSPPAAKSANLCLEAAPWRDVRPSIDADDAAAAAAAAGADDDDDDDDDDDADDDVEVGWW